MGVGSVKASLSNKSQIEGCTKPNSAKTVELGPGTARPHISERQPRMTLLSSLRLSLWRSGKTQFSLQSSNYLNDRVAGWLSCGVLRASSWAPIVPLLALVLSSQN